MHVKKLCITLLLLANAGSAWGMKVDPIYLKDFIAKFGETDITLNDIRNWFGFSDYTFSSSQVGGKLAVVKGNIKNNKTPAPKNDLQAEFGKTVLLALFVDLKDALTYYNFASDDDLLKVSADDLEKSWLQKNNNISGATKKANLKKQEAQKNYIRLLMELKIHEEKRKKTPPPTPPKKDPLATKLKTLATKLTNLKKALTP